MQRDFLVEKFKHRAKYVLEPDNIREETRTLNLETCKDIGKI